jgi:hypothetical protein
MITFVPARLLYLIMLRVFGWLSCWPGTAVW